MPRTFLDDAYDPQPSYEESWGSAPAMPKSGAGRKPSPGFSPAALVAALNGDLKNALAASTPGGIEAQEAAGQQDFVASSSLPKEMRGATRKKLEKIGFKFGKDVDDLFVSVVLPDGWFIKATEHSMHNSLFDANGSERAGVFYKAAFYDRRATMNMNRRYSVRCDYQNPICKHAVHDDKLKTKLFETEGAPNEDWKASEADGRAAEQWLTAAKPDHLDPLAYWDDK